MMPTAVETILGALLVVLANFFSRFFLIKKITLVSAADTYTYLNLARDLQENGFKPPHESSHSFFKSPFDYPPFFVYIVALAPKNNKILFGRIAIILSEILHSLLVFGVALVFSKNLLAACLAGILFAFTPASTSEAFIFTPRPIGAFFLSAAFIFLTAFASTSQVIWLAVAVLFAALVFLTHRMATQTMLFLSVALWIALGDPVFLAPFLIGLALFVVTGGWIARVWRGHLGILNFWRKNIKRRREAFGKYKILGISQGSIIYSLAGFLFNPWLLFALLAFSAGLTKTFLGSALFYWVAATSLFAFATAFWPLTIFGENRRYLEYGTLPAFVLASTYLAKNLDAMTAALFFSCVVVCVAVFVLLVKHIRSQYKTSFEAAGELREALEFIKRRREERVFCIPEVNHIVSYECDKITSSFYSATLYEKNRFLIFQDELIASLPAFIKKFGVELFLLEKSFLKKVAVQKRWRKVFENKVYVVYKTA